MHSAIPGPYVCHSAFANVIFISHIFLCTRGLVYSLIFLLCFGVYLNYPWFLLFSSGPSMTDGCHAAVLYWNATGVVDVFWIIVLICLTYTCTYTPTHTHTYVCIFMNTYSRTYDTSLFQTTDSYSFESADNNTVQTVCQRTVSKQCWSGTVLWGGGRRGGVGWGERWEGTGGCLWRCDTVGGRVTCGVRGVQRVLEVEITVETFSLSWDILVFHHFKICYVLYIFFWHLVITVAHANVARVLMQVWEISWFS